MSNHQHEELSFARSINNTFGWLQIAASPTLLFDRVPGSMGRGMIGQQTLFGAFLYLFTVGLANGPAGIYGFHAILVMALAHRVAGLRRPKNTPSRYTGLPWATKVFGIDELRWKGAYGPCLLLVAAVACGGWCAAMTYYLIAAAIGQAADHSAWKLRKQVEVEQIVDAMNEAEYTRRQVERIVK